MTVRISASAAVDPSVDALGRQEADGVVNSFLSGASGGVKNLPISYTGDASRSSIAGQRFHNAEQAQRFGMVGGRQFSKDYGNVMNNAAEGGVLNFPSTFARWLYVNAPMLVTDRMRTQVSGMLHPGIADETKTQAAREVLKEKFRQANFGRRFVQGGAAAVGIGATIAAIDAVRKFRRAKKLREDLSGGAEEVQKTAGLQEVYDWIAERATGFSDGRFSTALPLGAAIPLAAGGVMLGTGAGYKAVDWLSDEARSRWLREQKLKARKRFSDALTGMTKVGSDLSAEFDSAADELIKVANSPSQLAVRGGTGTLLVTLAALASAGALAGKAIADSRDKGRLRLENLEKDIAARAVPNRTRLVASSEATPFRRLLSTGEAPIPIPSEADEVLDPAAQIKVGGWGNSADVFKGKGLDAKAGIGSAESDADAAANRFLSRGQAGRAAGTFRQGLNNLANSAVDGVKKGLGDTINPMRRVDESIDRASGVATGVVDHARKQLDDSSFGQLAARFSAPGAFKSVGSDVANGMIDAMRDRASGAAGDILAWLQRSPDALRRFGRNRLSSILDSVSGIRKPV